MKGFNLFKMFIYQKDIKQIRKMFSFNKADW